MLKELFSIEISYLPLLVGFVGVLGILIGAFATAFLTEIRTWLENRRQNKRQLKSALFHQIELLGSVLALDKELLESYVESLTESLKNLGLMSDVTESVFGGIPTELFVLLEKVKADDMKEIIQKHENIILKLSEIDPLFAVNMSYRSRMKMPEQMQMFIGEINNIPLEKNEIVNEFAEHITHWQQVKARKRLIDSLQKGVIEIAWRISWVTWWKTKKEMKDWRKKIKVDIKNEVKDYIQEIINFSLKNQEKITKEINNALKEKDK